MSYTYKWIEPAVNPPFKKRIRRTRGAFVGWTQPTGICCVPYAIFRNRASEVLIPRYDLTAETLAAIGHPPTTERGGQ
jgi:hypothetical protein